MPKVIFILQRKPGTTRDACLKFWEGKQHTSIVRTIPGLVRWVQNSCQLRSGRTSVRRHRRTVV